MKRLVVCLITLAVSALLLYAAPPVGTLSSPGTFILRGASVCCECGWTLEQVFLVDQGKLREVWRSSVMSD